jgi:hypothetical protein
MKPSNERIGGYRPGRGPGKATRAKVGRFSKKELPSKVDLREHLTDVEEQVGNSCVANAMAGAYEYLAKRELGESTDVSRLFIYYNARYYEDCCDDDCGSQMEKAIEGLIEYGACAEDLWPNDEDNITSEPDSDAYEQAGNFCITESEYIETDLDLWKHKLAEGYPIAFALNTFNSFDEATTNKGRVPMPRKSDNIRKTHGWHAMLCVGYSDPDERFIVRNSWGPEWGQDGYCYIPYSYVIHDNFNGHDSWVIKGVNNLDFSEGVWDDSEESEFAEEGTLYVADLTIRVEDVEEFTTALAEFCVEWVEDENNFYFDYEEDEEDEGLLYVTGMELNSEYDEDDILEALGEFCDEWAVDEEYEFAEE